MTITHEQLPVPRGICGACWSLALGQWSSNGVFAVYCPHHHAGGFLEQGPGRRPLWQVFTPIGAEEFDMLKCTEAPVTLPMKAFR